MIKLQTKEHLIYFMQSGLMKLGNYDLSFIQNLHHMINNQKGITTNQAALLDKIIDKYKRQFNKQKFTIEFLKSLPWTHDVIHSDPQFTEAYILTEEDKIYFRSPFNKKFINELRTLSFNPFKWNGELKRYEAKLDTLALKIINTLGTKHFPTVNYCPNTNNLLNKLENFSGTEIWEPTLVKIKDRFYIAASNEFLDDAIKDITLSTDIKTITKLGEYGVKCSANLSEDSKIRFASNFINEVELPQLDEVITWLAEIGCDAIYFFGLTHVHTRNELFNKLKSYNIDCHTHREIIFSTVPSTYNYPVLIQFFSSVRTDAKIDILDIKKVVKVSNSYPIILKK